MDPIRLTFGQSLASRQAGLDETWVCKVSGLELPHSIQIPTIQQSVQLGGFPNLQLISMACLYYRV